MRAAERTELARSGEFHGRFPQFPEGSDAYPISIVQVTGTTVIWDNTFRGDVHNCADTGNEAVVKDGKIVMWTFASSSECD